MGKNILSNFSDQMSYGRPNTGCKVCVKGESHRKYVGDLLLSFRLKSTIGCPDL